jgi:ATP-binding cassette subfamily C protein
MVARTVAFSMVAVVLGLLTLLPSIAMLTGAAVAISMTALVLLTRVARRRFEAALVAEERVSETGSRVLLGLRDVLACGATAQARETVGQAVDRHARARLATAPVAVGRLGVIAMGARVPLLMTMLAASPLVSSHEATAGEILGAVTYLLTGLEPA